MKVSNDLYFDKKGHQRPKVFSKQVFVFIYLFFDRFGRKLSAIRGVVEKEIQAMVSKRDNIATHFPYQAWDPVPSLSSSSAGRTLKHSYTSNYAHPIILSCFPDFSLFIRFCAGTLISHEKLLLQINTEREIGNMDYKMGQVRECKTNERQHNKSCHLLKVS